MLGHIKWYAADATSSHILPTHMLHQLTIRNYVLVDKLDISFASGLTGITGESGAGKSILLGALGLLMGDRAKAESVRPGTEKADVSAEFALRPGSALHQRLCADELIEASDEYCLIRRIISAEGRSRAFINSIPVTLGYLKNAAEHLVDIQDKNQHQRLTDRIVQRNMLDEFAERNWQQKYRTSGTTGRPACKKSSACRGSSPPKTTAEHCSVTSWRSSRR